MGSDEKGSRSAVTTQKTPGLATTSLVCGIAGLALFFIPFVGFLLGLAALTSGVVSRKNIIGEGLTKGRGVATAGFSLGIAGTVVGVLVILIFIPNYLNISRRPVDNPTRRNMQRVQWALDSFADAGDGRYPAYKNDKDPNGCPLSRTIPAIDEYGMQNPFHRRAIKIVLMNETFAFPGDTVTIPIAPGDIRVYSDGKKYLIMGGSREGKSLSYRIRSWGDGEREP